MHLIPMCYTLLVGVMNLLNTLGYPAALRFAVLLCGAIILVAQFPRHSLPRFQSVRVATVIISVGLFQSILLFQIVRPLFVGSAGSEFSVTSLLLQGLLPFAWLFTGAAKYDPEGYNYARSLMIGLIVTIGLSLMILPTPFGMEYQVQKYAEVTGGEHGGRYSLPFFSGIVVGGVFGAILIVTGAAIWLFPSPLEIRKRRIIALFAITLGLCAVWLSGSRGAFVFSFASLVLLVAARMFPSKAIGLVVGGGVILFSVGFPFLFKSLRRFLLQINWQPLQDFLSRGDGLEPMTLAGRTQIWESFGSRIGDVPGFLFGYGPGAELKLRLNIEFNQAVYGYYSENTYLSHFHNLTYNSVYNTGVVGTFLFWAAWLVVWVMSWGLLERPAVRAVSLGVLGLIALQGATESLLSLSYDQYTILFVLISGLLAKTLSSDLGNYKNE